MNLKEVKLKNACFTRSTSIFEVFLSVMLKPINLFRLFSGLAKLLIIISFAKFPLLWNSIFLILLTVSLPTGFNKVSESFPSVVKSHRFWGTLVDALSESH